MEAAGKRHILHGSRSDEFRIWHMSDLHLMAKGCAEDRIRADVKEIAADPYSFWLGGGDYVDFIGYTDKRFDPDSVAEWVTVKHLGDIGATGKKRILSLLGPIKNKCLGMLLGNHELRYQLQTQHESLHGWICEEMGTPNLGYCAFFDLVFLRKGGVKKPTMSVKRPATAGKSVHAESFRVFAHHGAGYAQTPGGKLNRLIQFMQSFDADIYFCGHVHDKVARKQPAIGANDTCNDLCQRTRLGCIAGSYLKTYTKGHTGYGEQRAYAPTALGPAIVKIKPETRAFSAEV